MAVLGWLVAEAEAAAAATWALSDATPALGVNRPENQEMTTAIPLSSSVHFQRKVAKGFAIHDSCSQNRPNVTRLTERTARASSAVACSALTKCGRGGGSRVRLQPDPASPFPLLFNYYLIILD